ncbi:MAG: hypothetical protein ALECFALPRED_001401 [Alectoria fallacina]|uniref:Uncharacterized protein n=1 Tax=Alectoria fallacina TaxID=1903189 RepID=A0A8H3F8M6_9LECA|nr:MAG: hypothetical protein ALECFALPRED_001401 [Alectoria fallacina]
MVQLFLDEADNNAQSGIMKTLSKELLDEGADVNAQSGHDGNALRAASLRGHSHVGSGSKSRLKAKKEISEWVLRTSEPVYFDEDFGFEVKKTISTV